MLSLDTYRKVFLYSKPCDMRKGFNGLHALVLDAMELDVRCGDLFVLMSRDRSKAKTLYYRRLEKGTFKCPQNTIQ